MSCTTDCAIVFIVLVVVGCGMLCLGVPPTSFVVQKNEFRNAKNEFGAMLPPPHSDLGQHFGWFIVVGEGLRGAKVRMGCRPMGLTLFGDV